MVSPLQHPERVAFGPSAPGVRRAHLEIQLILLPLSVALVGGIMASRESEGLWRTLLLLMVVAVGGLALITRLSQQLQDPHIQKLGYIFLAKLPLLLLLLYIGWVPILNPSYANDGYDPVRFYFQAGDLAQNGFSLAQMPSLAYTGILFYYGALFAAVGHNPVAPALLNAFVTLAATLLLVRVGYMVKSRRDPRDWTLGLCMVIPEVLWFDALTARETLASSLITIASLSIAGYCLGSGKNRLARWQAAASAPVLLVLGVVRTTMLPPTVLATGLFLVLCRLRASRRRFGLILVGLAVGIAALAPALSMAMGGYGFDYLTQILWRTRPDQAFLSSVSWSERSLGLLLVPGDPLQAVLFTPARMVADLITPLPSIHFGLAGLAGGQWQDWQMLAVTASALLYVALLPLALASLIRSLAHSRRRNEMAFHLPLWVTLVAIAGGNQIIEARYRLMAALLLWGCMWLGRDCSPGLLRQVYAVWLGFLLLCGLFYAAYKLLPW